MSLYQRILVPLDGSETARQGLRKACEAIVDDARESACDLIVIGTHGRRAIARHSPDGLNLIDGLGEP